mmetsp:Transcript_33969/g.80141  ORF Transcript_33969/g.80141 Transcript_33969/m.80141 type:complete len:212 (+) Transcript_33969:494-1129(+)|eukprot:1660611-Rhodomonas_salina.1
MHGVRHRNADARIGIGRGTQLRALVIEHRAILRTFHFVACVAAAARFRVRRGVPAVAPDLGFFCNDIAAAAAVLLVRAGRVRVPGGLPADAPTAENLPEKCPDPIPHSVSFPLGEKHIEDGSSQDTTVEPQHCKSHLSATATRVPDNFGKLPCHDHHSIEEGDHLDSKRVHIEDFEHRISVGPRNEQNHNGKKRDCEARGNLARCPLVDKH